MAKETAKTETKKTSKKAEVKKTEAKKTAKSESTKSIGKSDDFVIVNIKSAQEKIAEGDVFEIARIEGKEGVKVKFDHVLLTSKSGKTTIGKPIVAGAVVEAEIVEQYRGEKIHTRTYKAKSRYRKHTGHRADLTKLKVTNIKY